MKYWNYWSYNKNNFKELQTTELPNHEKNKVVNQQKKKILAYIQEWGWGRGY